MQEEKEKKIDMVNIGINGFGRIGRMAFRAAMERTDVQVVAVNDLLDLPQLAYLLKHDSVHGRFRRDVAVKDRFLVVDGRPIRTTAVKDPAESAWGDVGADVVIESTGIFLTSAKAEAHLRAGARGPTTARSYAVRPRMSFAWPITSHGPARLSMPVRGKTRNQTRFGAFAMARF